MPYVLEPHVAGELGDGTELDTTTHPPVVSALEYLLDTPHADDLIESFPVFMVSPELGAALVAARLSGVTLTAATTGPSCPYEQIYGDAPVPEYLWLHPGEVGDDVAVNAKHRLVVSDRAWDVIKEFRLTYCDLTEC